MTGASATALGPVPRTLLIVMAGCLAFGGWQSRTPAVATARDVNGAPAACVVPRIGAAPTPVQLGAAPTMPPFLLGDHRTTPRAGFAVEATVLGVERYRLGREAAVSPLDLALGWGPMADPANYEALDISQSGRWYHYRWGPEGPPLPLETIIASSSNMHMIPANSAIAKRLDALDEGHRVRLTGWLVDIETPDGYRWSTSLRRDDSGDGACEIVYVCEVTVLP
ncbi:hypothetical protein GCM10028794_04870 [Silanimonas algicola]